MKYLCLECSAGPASAAVLEDGKVLSSTFCNIKLTHSQTLMPMVESVLRQSLTDLSEIAGIAVSAGPGSFTGIRIGISAVKGLAAAGNIPCAAVSTLSAMVPCFSSQNCIVCCVMDARCNQVYNALFRVENGVITRLCDDRALMCNELAEEIKQFENDLPVIITGDGTNLFYNFVKTLSFVRPADECHRWQNAVGVGLCAQQIFNENQTLSAAELLPIYLRLPQAERELKKRQEERKL
ncbi:MAG: tRNA (adenosine(37)-N6)-threonylcarbamoyltransferase complex dimerization subunit type 1 TsaB [Clostridia bacterium]|nr:tRNA (adenosine(37)-N6)-threonylcarbamoyltransferase complex dimerization subunit type 1 TsaB [Clostridia bacterium]